MPDLPLSLACWTYDRTRPLIDGRVKPEGIELKIEVMRPRVAFDRMLKSAAFDVSEMSFANYASLVGQGDCPLVAIPVMLSKMFRHDCFYVRADSGISALRDLAGRRVGTMRYSSTAQVYARGLLSDECGLRPRDIHWFIGGINEPMASARPESIAADAPCTVLTPAQSLDVMLLAGEIDAMSTQDLPESFLNGDPRIRRLFADPKAAQIDYHRRTGIFPIMHVVALRREVHEAHPWAAAALYKAFCRAKDEALGHLYDTDALHLALPFLIDHYEEAVRCFGPDFFSYGAAANRPAVAALCRYLYEQNLSPRLVAPEELFAPVAN